MKCLQESYHATQLSGVNTAIELFFDAGMQTQGAERGEACDRHGLRKRIAHVFPHASHKQS